MKSYGKRLGSAVIVALAIIAGAVLSQLLGGSSAEDGTSKAVSGDSIMSVTFVDVGQGDCELIGFPDGKCMLIDSGEAEYCDEVEERLRQNGYDRIDWLVVTHPHTDHMGGMSSIISDFDVGEIYMPYAVSDTRAYERLLEAIDSRSLTVNTAGAGVTVTFSDDISGEFLAPVGDSYDGMNNYSAVLKLTYNDVSFLFTGDAETFSEDEMLDNSYSSLDCDVLKVSHHGSSSSSSQEFINAVSPEYAVIECGANNRYGHPHTETLSRLDNAGAVIYRTDLSGDIVFKTDGEAIEIID